MSTEITIKSGVGVPKAVDIAEAELAIDIKEGTLYSKLSDGTVTALNGGGDGAGMVISATEPANPVTGMQWLESTTADVWIWDDDKWLQFPASGGGYETNSVDGGSASSVYLPDQVIDGGSAAG
jgi:hypothetical protein